MKKIFWAGILASAILSSRGQSTSQSIDNSSPPPNLPPGLEKRDELPPGLQNRSELPPGLEKRWGVDSNEVMAATNDYHQPGQTSAQPPSTVQTQPTTQYPNQLPATGQATGVTATTNQAGTLATSGALRVQALTAADQPIATQVQQVLVAEPVLEQALPGLNIQVNGGVIVLSGNVQCPAEGVLAQNIIYQKLPHTVRIENRLKTVGGAMVPAYVPR